MLTENNITVINSIFNKDLRMDSGAICTHIYGVHWEDIKTVNIIKSGIKDNVKYEDSTEVYIPFNADCDKKYKKPLEYAKNSDGAFTFRAGDYIVKGIVEFSGSLTEIPQMFDDVLKITSVDTYDYGSDSLRHWLVSGK